ncbi:MAG: hypothetical protein LBQ66_05545 [Planctomycetaceae bacterium]|nr:hypothetical protein [Planctomycetaceae bacterium]
MDIKNSRFPPRCGGLDYVAPLGRWILKIHDSHRVAVGWIMLPRWGVGN